MELYSDEWLAYILSLEKERFGSFDTPKVDLKVKSKLAEKAKAYYQAELAQLQALRDQRDKIMFNAGRFVAGARDENAVVSKRLMDAIFDSE